ncbi:MAG: nuclear transport factor 2 family protein [Balneolaceae bacterium]
MKLFIIAVLFVNITAISGGNFERSEPDPVQEIEAVIEILFDGMRTSGGDMVRSAVTDDVTLQTVQGNERVDSDMNRFIDSVEQSEPGSLDEQLTSLTIHVDGNLATAWMDYNFYYVGEFSHCGVNSMNLLNTGTGWKIFSIVDTRRQENC